MATGRSGGACCIVPDWFVGRISSNTLSSREVRRNEGYCLLTPEWCPEDRGFFPLMSISHHSLHRLTAMSLQGAISLYPTGSRKYPYFTSGDQSSSKAVIFIGGLFNGLMTPPYLVDLSAALEKAGWRLQVFIASRFLSSPADRRQRIGYRCIGRARTTGSVPVVWIGTGWRWAVSSNISASKVRRIFITFPPNMLRMK